MRLFLKLALACFACEFSYFSSAFAAIEDTGIESDDQIVEVQLNDGSILSEGLSIYPEIEQGLTIGYFLPLGQIAKAVGFAIDVSPAQRLAKGWFIQEGRVFDFNGNTCRVFSNSELIVLPIEQARCKGVQFREDDIYVSMKLLSRLWPMDFTYEPYRLRIVIQPREKLPVQLRAERERLRAQGRLRDAGFPEVPRPFHLWSWPLIDFQLSQKWLAGPSRLGTSGTTDLGMIAGSQVFDLDSEINLHAVSATSGAADGGAEKGIDWKWRLGKQAAKGYLVDAVKLQEYRLLDVSTESFPTVTPGRAIRGAFISSYPIEDSSEFGSQTFRIDLLAGWDVELYQNDVFIRREVARDAQQVVIDGIPLYYGRNQFKFIYHGPQGQVRTEFKTFSIDPSFSKDPGLNYRVGVGTDGNQFSGAAILEHSISSRVAGRVGWARLAPALEKPALHYGLLGAQGFVENLYFSGSLTASESGGKALQAGLNFPLSITQNLLKATYLNHFESEELRRDHGVYGQAQLRLQSFAVLPTDPILAPQWILEFMKYEDSTWKLSNTARLVTYFWEIFWNADWTLDLGASTGTVGTIELSHLSPIGLLKAASGFRSGEFKTYSLELQSRISSRLTSHLRVRWDRSTSIFALDGTLARKWDMWISGLQAGINSKRDWSLGLMASSSLYWNPLEARVNLSSEGLAQSAIAAVIVFIDLNRNGLCDDGETRVPNQIVQISQTDREYITDENGLAWIPGLRANQPVDLTLSIRGLQDPSLKPVKKGVRFYPALGATTEVLYPLTTQGQIEGEIRFERWPKGKSVQGVNVELLDTGSRVVAKVQTDSYGAFWFEDVPPGHYTIQISKSELEKIGANPQTAQSRAELTVPEAGGVVPDLELHVKFQPSR